MMAIRFTVNFGTPEEPRKWRFTLHEQVMKSSTLHSYGIRFTDELPDDRREVTVCSAIPIVAVGPSPQEPVRVSVRLPIEGHGILHPVDLDNGAYDPEIGCKKAIASLLHNMNLDEDQRRLVWSAWLLRRATQLTEELEVEAAIQEEAGNAAEI